MSWEESFNHPLFSEDCIDKPMRKQRFDMSAYSNKENSAYRHSRSKSTQRITTDVNRTPRVRKQNSGMDYTPERISMWRVWIHLSYLCFLIFNIYFWFRFQVHQLKVQTLKTLNILTLSFWTLNFIKYHFNMIVLPIVGFLIIGVGNYASSRFGFSNFATGDKDILFPFAATSFLFFSLLIYLPEVRLSWRRPMGRLLAFSLIRQISKSNFKLKSKKINFR